MVKVRDRSRRAFAALGIVTALAGGSLATASAALPQSADGGTVRLLEFYSQSNNTLNLEWLDRMTEIFEAENPGWSVVYEATTFDQIDQKSILDHEAGVTHDVVLTSPQLMARHEQAGDLLDLTPYLTATYSDEQLADLDWSAGWEAAAFGDVQLGVPTGTHVRGAIANNEMLAAAGLDPATPIDSPAALMDAGIALRDAGVAAFPLGAFLGSNRATVEVTYAPLVWGFGGDFWEDDQPAIASAASVQAVEWIWDAVNEERLIAPFAAAADGNYDALVRDMFLDGQVGIALGFGSFWIAAVEDAGLTAGCFPASGDCQADAVTPIPSANADGAGFANAWNLSIAANSENPDMAWKLIEVMMRPEHIVEYPDAGLPPWRSIYDSAEYASPYWQAWRTAAENGRPVPQTPYYPELSDAIYVAIQQAIAGDRDDIAAILQNAEDEFIAAYMR